MAEDCIFCKIANGEIPCNKIWEDENYLAFLSIDPICDGHTIVIPKKHYENMFDVSESVIAGLNKSCKRISLMLKDKLNAEGINILNNSGVAAGQEVMHIHFHVFPRYKEDKLKLWFLGASENFSKLDEVAEKIRGEK